jgi:hypothetical protein
MQTPILLLDKQYSPDLETDLGKVGIRVVVFSKKQAVAPSTDEDQPFDLEADEDFTTSDSEVNSYLEFPKRGKLCCVFLINGQRHHGLDNAFIVNDLKMKYLRKRMIVIVDLDGLTQKANAEIMQGSRSGFFEGEVYHKIRERVIATLQNDPDLLDLEEEAEEELSQLQAGDAAVQEALDQLIEQHFDFGDHPADGGADPGGKMGHFFGADGKPVNIDVVTVGEEGSPALEPVLVSDHAASTLRLPPNTKTRLAVTVAPKNDWERLVNIGAFIEPTTPGLTCTFAKDTDSAQIEVEYSEPEDFDTDSYPLEATLRVMATLKDLAEPRLHEKTIVIRPRKKVTWKPRILNDQPTYLRVASRQPIRLNAGGPAAHVKLVWDGKDHLLFEPNPVWTFTATCKTHTNFPPLAFTKPTNGRFEVLVHTPSGLLVGTKVDFEIEAHGLDGDNLSAVFTAEIVAPSGPKKVTTLLPVKGLRRPPYKILYVKEAQFESATRWGDETWNASHAGAFMEPKDNAPLTLCLNEDFDLLRRYMDNLVAKKADEQRTSEKKTKYISHVAYHLYQMYLAKSDIQKAKERHADDPNRHEPQDEEMQEEINRVASTLIRLMEVMR